MSDPHPPYEPIAIVGVSALFPGSVDRQGFWRNILEGKDLIGDVPPGHWLIDDYYDADPSARDKTYAKRGGFLPEVAFDPLKWGVPPVIMPATDTTQLLALIVAERVIDDACRKQFGPELRARTSVFLGVTSAQELLGTMVSRLQRPVWIKALREMGLPESQVSEACDRIADHYVEWQESTFPGVLGNVVAGRIANRLDLGGSNCVIDAACASTFAAVSMGVNELRLRTSDLVIAGGADTMNDIFMYMCFSKTPALSASGDCRPFSDKADGTLLGEGIGMVALKRLADAEASGDRIYAVLAGLGASSDGRSKSVYAPVAAGQARAIRRAYEQAGHGPQDVELIEAHGTGTKAGDAAEFDGLRMVFEEGRSKAGQQPWCALGSIKSQIGHTKAAAGAAGLFKAVMALHHKVLPPTLKVSKPNADLKIQESPFFLNTASRPWIGGGKNPRRAGVSAFGFGGSNYHLALQEYVGPAPKPFRMRTFPQELVILTADSPAELAARCSAMAAELSAAAELGAAAEPTASSPGIDGLLGYFAAQTQKQYNHHASCRIALMADSDNNLRGKLENAASSVAEGKSFDSPAGVHFGMGHDETAIGLIFPGQGSQYVGMGADLAMHYDTARQVWDDAAAMAENVFDGQRLDSIVFPKPVFDDDARIAQSRTLTKTEWAQPAIGAASLSMLRLLQQIGITPLAVGGHSFGELTALLAASVISERDFLAMARKRGQLMADAGTEPGAMLSVQASANDVQRRLSSLGDRVCLANDNAPDQVVLSGPVADIEQAENKLKADGFRTTRLQVATAFHSPLVRAALQPFQAYLSQVPFSRATCALYANVTAEVYPEDADAMRSVLARQLDSRVRFVEMIEAMYARGVRTFVEVGPGHVLSRLIDRILDGRAFRTICVDRRGRHGVQRFQEALAGLVAAGVPIDLSPLWAQYQCVDDPRSQPQPEMTIMLSGTSHGKIYPPADGTPVLPAPNPERTQPSEAVQAAAAGQPEATGQPMAPTTGDLETPARVPMRPPIETTPTRQAMAHPAAGYPVDQGPHALTPHAQSPLAQAIAPAATSATPDWLLAFEMAQRQAAEAQNSYQRTLADSHANYMRSSENSLQLMASLLRDQGSAHATPTLFAPPPMSETARLEAPPRPVPQAVEFETSTPAPATAAPIPTVETVQPTTVSPSAVSPSAVSPSAASPSAVSPSSPEAPVVASAATSPATADSPAAFDLRPLILEVVAKATGYPEKMLGLDMSLEADLGIDSIKRVEILSALVERAPHLPEVPTAEVASLGTLGEILDFLNGLSSTTSAAQEPAPATAIADTVLVAKNSSPAPIAAEPIAAEPIEAEPIETEPIEAEPIDLKALMLQAVAEKTGYPINMISLEMDLEADLGIDSIKRVEILSAVRDLAPGLPEFPTAQMAELKTLGAIVELMSGGATTTADANVDGATAAPEAAVPATTAPTSTTPVAAATTSNEKKTAATSDSAQRAVVAPTPVAACGLATPSLRDAKNIVITDDRRGIATALQQALSRAGLASKIVASESIASGSTSTNGNSIDALIMLSPLRRLSGDADARAVNREAFTVARQIAKQYAAHGGLLVTAQDTGGDFGFDGSTRAATAGVMALVRTAAKEWPKASVRAIDVQCDHRSPAAVGEAICNELLQGGSTLTVGLRTDGTRLELCDRLVPVDPSTLETEHSGHGICLQASDVVLVSGGARGVTAATIIALAKDTGARFVLLGRTRLETEAAISQGIDDDAALKQALLSDCQARGETTTPNELQKKVTTITACRQIRETIARIEAAGGTARYETIDVTDRHAMRVLVERITGDWGKISAIIHGAGVIADRRIEDKLLDQFDRVFDTKVLGLGALLDATREQPLRLVCLFSSVAARHGNIGQSDYAMANEVLNKMAHRLKAQQPKRCVKSINWGPWRGGMVTPQLCKHFADQGIPLIELEAGARALVNEIRYGSSDVEVLIGSPFDGRAPAEPRRFFDVYLDAAEHEYLHDHQIGGSIVLPVAASVEIFVRAAQMLHPDLQVQSVSLLKVLRGVRIADFEHGQWFGTMIERVSNGDGVTLNMSLLDDKRARRYRATLHLGHPNDGATTMAARTLPNTVRPDDLQPMQGATYGRVLFHGPRLQVIEEIQLSDSGAVARLRGGHLPLDGWQTDLGLIDGALQVALLWTERVLGGPSLPTDIDQLELHAAGPVRGPVQCVLSATRSEGMQAVCDIVLTRANGEVVATLRGLRTCMLPEPRTTSALRTRV